MLNGRFRGCRCREAAHAGSWYPGDPAALRSDLEALLREAPRGCAEGPPPKALIVPHAGLQYCGRTASHAYANLQPAATRRIVVLGPSHHKWIEGCALPAKGLSEYATPLGGLPLDVEAIDALRGTGDFEELSAREDEAEHSIEMQLPFVALAMATMTTWSLLPIVVGDLRPKACARFAQHLAPMFDDPSTLFLISSDFCHWGSFFSYAPCLPLSLPTSDLVPGMGCAGEANPVNTGIEALDLRGMELICRQDGKAFLEYLEAEGNTICGQNPIRLLLELLAMRPGRFRVRFLHYSQSRLLGSKPGRNDSSVSYAAGVCEVVA